MMLLKCKVKNEIYIEYINANTRIHSDFKDDKLWISISQSISGRSTISVDSYSVYYNGSLIEHQDIKDYINKKG